MPLFWRRSKLDLDRSLDHPHSDLQHLLQSLGVSDPNRWFDHWLDRGIDSVGQELWPTDSTAEWLWWLAVPLLTIAEAVPQGTRHLIGLSALPGCGKTTLGRWLDHAAKELNLSLQVVSIDDFYWEGPALEIAMQGNPWGVPRALPGSHDLALMQRSLTAWKQGEAVDLPRFDKALRNGRGDRSGWFQCDADVLILEGWFLGCRPLDSQASVDCGADHLNPPIQPEELSYRRIVQNQLERYQPIWDLIDHLWQLSADDFNAPSLWKQQQESNQRRERGVGLTSQQVDRFIRMVLTAIPSISFESINADVCVAVDTCRRLSRISLHCCDQDSLSSDSLTG